MKAVILAGGEGKRLRPLTETVPKPMVPLFGKPVMEYLLDSLAECGCDEAIITLRYLPEVITHYFGSEYKGMKLVYSTESSPRGTAGAVKDAAGKLSEPFIVLSGDGVCCFDFKGILDFHIASGSECTVVCREVDDPCEYGLIHKDDENKIVSFSEKPGWNRADGNLANTGVYAVSPWLLDCIPESGSVDFAADIFPILLKEEKPFYAYKETGYWCDIGSPESYKICHRDIMNGKTTLKLTAEQKDVYTENALPHGGYTIIPPVYIGSGVTLGSNAVVGPFTVIGDGCTVSDGAAVRKSVLQQRVFLGEDTLVSDSVICSGATVKKAGRIFEGAVIGGKTVIGENSTVGSKVSIASEKTIGKNSIISENITEGFREADMLENGIISGAAFTEIPISSAAAAGAAFGSVKTGKYIAAGCDGKNCSRSILSAVSGGVVSAGGNIWNMGRCFLSEFLYMMTYSGMNGGIFVSSDNGIVNIMFFGEHGLAPDRKTERDCEYRLRRSDFSPCNPEYCGSVRDMSYLIPMYRRQLGLFKNEYYGGRSFFIKSDNEDIRDFCREFFGRRCVEEDGTPIFTVSEDGVKMTAVDELGEFASHDNLTALCCYDEFLQENDVAIPYDAPKIINRMAAEKNCHVLRYCDEDDAANSDSVKLISDCVWARDALFMIVKIMDMCIKYGTDLHGLLKKLPVFFVYEKSVSLASDRAYAGKIMRSLGESAESGGGAGIRITKPEGDVLITASSKGKRIRILAEAASEETASELCGEIEDRIHSILQE